MASAYDSMRFIKSQINAIETSKYIESEKEKRDLYFDDQGRPSQSFYLWWVKNHAENYRKGWFNSSCRKCSKVETCKNCLKITCEGFECDSTGLNNIQKGSIMDDFMFSEREIPDNDITDIEDDFPSDLFEAESDDGDLKELDFEN